MRVLSDLATLMLEPSAPSRSLPTSNRLRALLAGDPAPLARALAEPGQGWPLACVAVILLGGSVYGATLGWWRSPIQAFYTAVKFPLLVLLTCAGNALLNGMLGQVLGLGLSIRQSMLTILMSFALAAIVLVALSPVTLFLLWNTPPLAERNSTGHSLLLTIHVTAIAVAGIIANRRLLRLLERQTGHAATARKVLFAWLTGNLLLGSQLAYVLRPFVGNPAFPVQFLRPDPLRGNFFETFFHAIRDLLS